MTGIVTRPGGLRCHGFVQFSGRDQNATASAAPKLASIPGAMVAMVGNATALRSQRVRRPDHPIVYLLP
jgi:hypothetical protein